MKLLPPSLQHWSQPLEGAPLEVALGLGGMVTRLDAAIGPLRGEGHQPGDEHSGYAGISRRGLPERLLLSEWAVALEAPEEFLRRAVMSEQAFLAPEVQRPKATRRCVAILDCGPSMIGAPRIVQLALLVVLARRAEAAGLALEWTVLQSSSELRSGFGYADVERFLGARSATEPTREELERALSAAQGTPPRELWLIGGDGVHARAGVFELCRVRVVEPWAAVSTEVEVTIDVPGRAARTVQLPLPPPAECVRLLRDPFRQAAPKDLSTPRERRYPPVATPESFGFGAGNRLLYRAVGGEVIAIAIPNSPRATLGRHKRQNIPRDEVLVAAGWERSGGLFAITRTEKMVFVRNGNGATWACSRNSPTWKGSRSPLENPQPFAVAMRISGGRILCLDRDCNLVEILSGALRLKFPNAVAITNTWLRVVAAVVDESGARLWHLSAVEGRPADVPALPHQIRDCVPRAFFGFPRDREHPQVGLCALEVGEDDWRIFSKEGVEALHVDSPGFRAMGVLIAPLGREVEKARLVGRQSSDLVGLVGLDQSRRSIRFVAAQGAEDLFTATEPILHLATSTHGAFLAYATRKELVVLANGSMRPLLRVPVGAAG